MNHRLSLKQLIRHFNSPKLLLTLQTFQKVQRLLSQGVPKPPRQIPRERPAVRPGIFGRGYPLLLVPIAAFGLGSWQVQRLQWKLNLIKELEEKTLAPAVSLPENLEEVENMEYRKVKLRGKFDHSRELFIGPRKDVLVAQKMGGSQNTNGVNVITPFKLADRDETILVNRGFVPMKARPPQLRQEGQVEGEVEITGVVRLSDKKPYFSNDPFKDGFWIFRDIDQMAEVAGTAKIFIDADSSSTVPGGPVGGQTRVTLRNEHLTYIITWYALGCITFYLWYKNFKTPVPHKSVLEFTKQRYNQQR